MLRDLHVLIPYSLSDMGVPTPESPATVDASRPFRSVKEAVAIFGERLLPREMHLSPKCPSVSLEKEVISEEMHTSPQNTSFSLEIKKMVPHSSEITPSSKECPNTSSSLIPHSSEITQSLTRSPSIVGKEIAKSSFTNEHLPSLQNFELANHGNVVHGNDLVMMLMVLKKLEAEVQDTKMELKLLKERESETEVALAALNAELHKNMPKIAKAEATDAAKAAKKSRALLDGGSREISTREEERSRGDMIVKNLDSPTLAKILSMTDYDGYLRQGKKAKNQVIKKKPVIPLVTDIFPWKKRSSSPNHDLSGSWFSSHLYF